MEALAPCAFKCVFFCDVHMASYHMHMYTAELRSNANIDYSIIGNEISLQCILAIAHHYQTHSVDEMCCLAKSFQPALCMMLPVQKGPTSCLCCIQEATPRLVQVWQGNCKSISTAKSLAKFQLYIQHCCCAQCEERREAISKRTDDICIF